MYKNMILYILAVLSQLTFCSASNLALDKLVAGTIEKYQIPSISAAVIFPDTCIYSAQGVNRVGAAHKININMKFHLGSNTKAVTSFIAMKMIEEGKISLTSKFIDMFPELKNEISINYHCVTFGNLLSHQAGIQPYTSGLEFLKIPELDSSSLTNKRYDFAKFILNEDTVSMGTYSNAGYVLAALMLEKCSGKSFELLLDETMREMQLEYFIGFPNKEHEEYPWGHWLEDGELRPLGPGHFYRLKDFMLPAGDLSMNIIDYSKFVKLHLMGAIGEDNYLKKESYKTLHFGIKGYSYGWGNAVVAGVMAFFHDGSAGTYYCHTIVFPDKKFAVVIMANSAQPGHVKGIYELRQKISEYFESLKQD